MADTPIWVQLITPVITAGAAWLTSKLDLFSYSDLKEYEGTWFAYYRDPDNGNLEEEIWKFGKMGSVAVERQGKTTFKGRLSLKGAKAYMHVEAIKARRERLFVMLDPPTNPRTASDRPPICLWLGQDGSGRTTAGHGLLSRTRLQEPTISAEFIRAGPHK